MSVLVTCKNEEDPIKNESARVVTSLSLIFKRSRAANAVVSDGILMKFKLNQAFIVVLVTTKYEEDSSKNEGTRVGTTFIPI